MKDYKDILKTAENQNWAKCSVAIWIATQPLLVFCQREIEKFHLNITLKLSPGSACYSCKLEEVIPYSKVNHRCRRPCKCPSKPCPNNVCDKIRTAVEQQHKFKEISWQNTNIEKWQTDAWELAKCYFPLEGYKSKTTEETDLNAILSLIHCNELLGKNFSFQDGFEKVCQRVCMLFRKFLTLLRENC